MLSGHDGLSSAAGVCYFVWCGVCSVGLKLFASTVGVELECDLHSSRWYETMHLCPLHACFPIIERCSVQNAAASSTSTGRI